ncbi:hypothetical protein Tsubulata_040339 [Turnera subulata]|uniref:SAM-dependent MTase DRM-type domain-containing protein n=1 Tax=Turnera subulata TaxID=218843 RepID=A0A9Q0FZ07_9ROSI|nr:hypothetical protein Tsubulata_040339 [Turnera subulata]
MVCVCVSNVTAALVCAPAAGTDNRKNYPIAGQSSSSYSYAGIVPKPEAFDFEEEPEPPLNSNQLGGSVASSSGSSNVRSFFIGMGYLPSLVDKVIQENGEENIDLLMDILMDSRAECPDLQMQSNLSSDYLNGKKDASGLPQCSTFCLPKEDPDVFDEVDDDKRACLVKMKFHPNEIEFAMDKLGEEAPVNEIVDFILAARIAKNLDQEPDDVSNGDGRKNKVTDDEEFETMEKTLRLLETGFTENEISLAVERMGKQISYLVYEFLLTRRRAFYFEHVQRYGNRYTSPSSDAPAEELAEFICAHQLGETYVRKTKYASGSISIGPENGPNCHPHSTVKIETDSCMQDATSTTSGRNMDEIRKGKRPKKVHCENHCDSRFGPTSLEGNYSGEELKQEYSYEASTFGETTWEEEKVDPTATAFQMPQAFRSVPCKVTNATAAKAPYFFFGNVESLAPDNWKKICQFLYVTHPEIVNTGFFSALNREEGYVHNLGAQNRFRIEPEPPMTIQDAIPGSKKWWPAWDTRKQMRFTNFEASGAQVSKLGNDSCGLLSPQQKNSILRGCEQYNLVWVGPNKLAPVEPKHLEWILGYPLNHTLVGDSSQAERLSSLKLSFQIDTLAYHLSALKSMFPGGIAVLSFFSGIGGPEIALHRLGIPLKGVVSVETCETNRRILKRWWISSGQRGQLEQIDDVQKLTTDRVEGLVERFGRFDFIICQNALTHSSKRGPAGVPKVVFDFASFHEFVRVLARLRDIMERS